MSGAFIKNAPRLKAEVCSGLQEQLREAIPSIADRSTIHLGHVSEENPIRIVDRNKRDF